MGVLALACFALVLATWSTRNAITSIRLRIAPRFWGRGTPGSYAFHEKPVRYVLNMLPWCVSAMICVPFAIGLVVQVPPQLWALVLGIGGPCVASYLLMNRGASRTPDAIDEREGSTYRSAPRRPLPVRPELKETRRRELAQLNRRASPTLLAIVPLIWLLWPLPASDQRLAPFLYCLCAAAAAVAVVVRWRLGARAKREPLESE
jgi:hypothetical protein